MATSFRYDICAYLHVHLYYRSYADVLHIGRLFYYRRCLFSVLELDERYKWRVISPNTHPILFPISHLCALTRTTWKVLVIYERSAWSIKRLLHYCRHSWCSLDLLERSDWRATAPDTYRSSSDTTLCAYTSSPYMHASPIGAQLRMPTKLTYLMTAYYTPYDAFTANAASFYMGAGTGPAAPGPML